MFPSVASCGTPITILGTILAAEKKNRYRIKIYIYRLSGRLPWRPDGQHRSHHHITTIAAGNDDDNDNNDDDDDDGYDGDDDDDDDDDLRAILIFDNE